MVTTVGLRENVDERNLIIGLFSWLRVSRLVVIRSFGKQGERDDGFSFPVAVLRISDSFD